MHGELLRALCLNCHKTSFWDADLGPESVCRKCRQDGELRPDIVWFGEMPYHQDECFLALSQADLFLAVGTSGKVYPAADFVSVAKRAGAHTIEFNLEPSDVADAFDEHITGPAGTVLPRWVEDLLASH